MTWQLNNNDNNRRQYRLNRRQMSQIVLENSSCAPILLWATGNPRDIESSSINRETKLHLLACCLKEPAKH